jgi:hypothetical protein
MLMRCPPLRREKDAAFTLRGILLLLCLNVKSSDFTQVPSFSAVFQRRELQDIAFKGIVLGDDFFDGPKIKTALF